jgi:hypothetical protein
VATPPPGWRDRLEAVWGWLVASLVIMAILLLSVAFIMLVLGPLLGF